MTIPSTWVITDQDTSTLVEATKAALPNHRHYVTRVTVSADIAFVNSVVVVVKSGSTVLDQWEVAIAAIGPIIARDYNHPLQGGVNEAIVISVPDAGASVVVTAVAGGFTRPS